MLNAFFPVRPVPQKDESLKGYALRVAYYLGYQTLNELHSMIDIRYSKGCYDLTSKASICFVSKLAQLLQIGEDELRQTFKHFDSVAVVYDRPIKDIHNVHPKVCVECAKETQGYIMSHDSLLAHHTHCEKHKIELVDTCPACKERLLWVSDVFEGCSCWQVRWREIDALPSFIPVYQQVANELTRQERRAYLMALYQNVVTVLRPKDIIEHSFRILPPVEGNLTDIFTQAYSLLVNVKYQAQHTQLQRQHLQLSMPNLPIEKLLSKKTSLNLKVDLPLVDCPMTFVEYGTQLPDSLVNLGIDAQYLLTRFQVSQLLSISEEDVMSLQEYELLYVLNPDSKSYLFDMREVNTLSEKLITKATTSKGGIIDEPCIVLADISRLALKNGCSIGQLFKQLLKGNISLFQNDSTEFCHLYINKKELINYFEMTFFSELSYPRSLSQLKNLTCLADEELTLFVEYLKISPFSVSAKKVLYPPEQLKLFFKEKLLLNRWAKLNKVKVGDVRFYLKNYEIYPACKVLDKEGIYIYDQEPKLIKMLRQYLLDVQRYKGELPLSLCLKYIQSKSPQVIHFFK